MPWRRSATWSAATPGRPIAAAGAARTSAARTPARRTDLGRQVAIAVQLSVRNRARLSVRLGPRSTKRLQVGDEPTQVRHVRVTHPGASQRYRLSPRVGGG